MDYIFIDSKSTMKKMGIVEGGRLVEYSLEIKEDSKLLGNIYRGRIINVLRGMDAAFVDIGIGKNAYLHVNDALKKDQLYKDKDYKINEVIRQGEDIIVQVIKDAVGDKAPKLTTHISIPARYTVLTPYSRTVNISRKIQDKKETKRLKALGQEIIVEDMGIIFRTNASGVDEEILREEYKNLLAIYGEIEGADKFLSQPKLLYGEADESFKLIRDSYNEKKYKIIVNSKEVYKTILKLGEDFSGNLEDNLEYREKFDSDMDRVISRGLREALARSVDLPSGGSIVIDETEALTAVDVNTGKFIGSYSLKGTSLQTNLEACEEIARQIRLRNLAGIIIIDFIDMTSRRDISKVLSSLKEYFDLDRNKPNLIGMTKLGLAQVTRRRKGPSLGDILMEECDHCKGRGRLRK